MKSSAHNFTGGAIVLYYNRTTIPFDERRTNPAAIAVFSANIAAIVAPFSMTEKRPKDGATRTTQAVVCEKGSLKGNEGQAVRACRLKRPLDQ